LSVLKEEIQVNKCFVTLTKQVRRVMEIVGDDVTYESRGSKATVPVSDKVFNSSKTVTPAQFSNKTTVKIDKFAADVDRQVKCDWDAGFPEQSP